ncbi:hypothetical protein SD457_01125 [Coprobacillaceae bacterium CR2/5/TPMF4]|nr:hypothetical protein SD457_01125 [Coprobacillaceae bacterium CR2/5/TPMF4]
MNRESIEVINGNFTTWYEQKQNQDNLEVKKNEKLKKILKDYKKQLSKVVSGQIKLKRVKMLR